jgi:3-dehydroquinate dehydratase-2
MTTISVINGPSLGMLGEREPEVYGNATGEDLERVIRSHALGCGAVVTFQQHDLQGELVRAVNLASTASRGLVINPGAYSHTSVALLDAMRSFRGPVVEVHISQIHRREPYRHRMLTAQGADAVISGAGIQGYISAIDIIMEILRR